MRRSLSPRALALRHGPLDIDPAQKRKEDAEGVDLGVKDNDVGDGAVGGGGLVDEDKDGEEHRGQSCFREQAAASVFRRTSSSEPEATVCTYIINRRIIVSVPPHPVRSLRR